MKTNCNGSCRVIYDYYTPYIHNFSRREGELRCGRADCEWEVPVIFPSQASQMYLSCDFGNKSFIFWKPRLCLFKVKQNTQIPNNNFFTQIHVHFEMSRCDFRLIPIERVTNVKYHEIYQNVHVKYLVEYIVKRINGNPLYFCIVNR